MEDGELGKLSKKLTVTAQRHFGTSRADAEDLVHDAFVRVEKFSRTAGEIRSLRALWMSAMYRLGINRYHKLRRRSEREGPPAAVEAEDDAPGPDEVFAAEQCLRRITIALDAVGVRMREILFMHRFEGLTHQEIAARMGVSVSLVEKEIARAIEILRQEGFGDC
jgi:RNA polymerase sigma factor (sigma-70 family)